jgi:hypothetical protein
MATFAPYQVDFTLKNASKTFGFSKKRISFKFGVASEQAMAQGLTGAHCRGSEHEIIFVWSLNNGKRQILADGKDVHFSESGQNGWTTDQVFQHHFQLQVPNLDTALRCHLITQPANRDMPNIRPFDLRVNGISYFQMSKIFQLGTAGMISRPLRGGGHGGGGGGGGRGGGRSNHHQDPEEDPYCTPDERRAIAAAKLESLRDVRGQEQRTTTKGEAGERRSQMQPYGVAAASSSSPSNNMQRDEGSLISFDDPTPPPPAQGPPNQFLSSMTMDPALMSGNSWEQRQPPPPQQQQNQQPPPGGGYSNYSLGQPPPAAAAQQQQPNPYGQPPAPGSGGALTPYYQPPGGAPPAPFGAPPQQQQQQQYGAPPNNNNNSQYGGFTSAPAPTFDQTQQAFGAMPYPQQVISPSNQTVASYGSAPSFAQPPQQQQQQQPPQYQQQQQPNNPYGNTNHYAQPPPPQGYPQPHY